MTLPFNGVRWITELQNSEFRQQELPVKEYVKNHHEDISFKPGMVTRVLI
jgi:hypothetical protein